MKTIPENTADVRKILLNQMALVEQESERNPDKLTELTLVLCKLAETFNNL